MTGQPARTTFHMLRGRPAVTVRTLPSEAGERVVMMTLAEGEDGVPFGGLGSMVADMLPLHDDPEAIRIGFLLACGWVDGDPLARRFKAPTRTPGQDLALATAAAAIPLDDMRAAGFSVAFVDTLSAMSGWRPHLALDPRSFRRFCGASPAACAIRDFTARHPLLADLYARRVADRLGRDGSATPESAIGLAPARLRAFEGRRWSLKSTMPDGTAAPAPARHELATLEAMAAELPLDWIPSDRSGIDAFRRAAKMLGVYGHLEMPLKVLAASAAGDWPGFVARCEAAAAPELWLPSPTGGSSYLYDPIHDLASKVLLPLLADPASDEMQGGPDIEGPALAGARRLMYRDMSLPSVVRTAREWHSRVAGIHRALPNEADVVIGANLALIEDHAARRDATEWQPLLRPATIDGLTLSCLTSERELRDEGAEGPDDAGSPGLNHCVATYRGRAALSRCHIVSIRRVADDGSYERLATAELRQRRDGSMETVQLMGRGNGAPPPGCEDALQAYIREPVPYIEPVQRVEVDGEVDLVRTECGFNWKDPEMLRQAVDAYAAFLPRGLRGDPAAITREVGLGRDAYEAPRP